LHADQWTDELKLLKDFFNADVDSNVNHDPDYCSKFRTVWDQLNFESSAYPAQFGKEFFFPANAQDGWTRLQTMFKLLPASANPKWADFAGMDKRLNNRKGE